MELSCCREVSAQTRAHARKLLFFFTDDANVVVDATAIDAVGIVAFIDAGDVTADVAVVAAGSVTYGTLGAFSYSLLVVVMLLWKF